MSPALDAFASARYQACCLDYNHCVKQLFGDRYGIDRDLGFTLQFTSLSREQLTAPSEADLAPSVRSLSLGSTAS